MCHPVTPSQLRILAKIWTEITPDRIGGAKRRLPSRYKSWLFRHEKSKPVPSNRLTSWQQNLKWVDRSISLSVCSSFVRQPISSPFAHNRYRDIDFITWHKQLKDNSTLKWLFITTTSKRSPQLCTFCRRLEKRWQLVMPHYILN